MIAKQINKYINDHYCFFGDEIIPPDCPLLTGNYIDSLSVLEIVCHLEHTFNISINDEEITLENFEKINSIISLVESKLNKEHHVYSSDENTSNETTNEYNQLSKACA